MKLSFTTRRFILIVLVAYFGVLAIVLSVSILSDTLTTVGTGTGLLYAGIAIFIIGFLILGSAGDKWSGASRSLHMQSDAHFKEWRKREKPVELVALAIILAAALLALTGYWLSHAVIS